MVKDATKVRLKSRAVTARIERTRALLHALFPLAIADVGEAKRPLKIGIGNDILLACPELSSVDVALALHDYTWGPTYCRNVIAGASRIDLAGAACGRVSQLEAEHAAARLRSFDRERAA